MLAALARLGADFGLEFAEFAVVGALHLLADLVDLRPRHIIQLAIVPDELQLRNELLRARKGRQVLPDSVQVHGVLNNFRVVAEPQGAPIDRVQKGLRMRILTQSVQEVRAHNQMLFT